MENKIWTQDEIKQLLVDNDLAVSKAIVSIYNLQTESEKSIKGTTDNNGVGFNGVDAEFLSSLAEFFIKYNRLSEKQIAFGRKKIMKYSKQLTMVANKEIQI
jgi:hypothetical protein